MSERGFDFRIVPRRRFLLLSSTVALAILMGSNPSALGVAAKASENEAGGDPDEQGDGDEGSDLPPPEPMVDGAAVIDEEQADLLKIGFDCPAQIAASIQQYEINPDHKGRVNQSNGAPKYNPPVTGDPNKPGDKIVGPLSGRRFRALFSGRGITGVSTATGEGEILFNGESLKGPATVLESRIRNTTSGRVSAAVGRVDRTPVQTQVPCGMLQRFPFRTLIRRTEPTRRT